MAGRRSLGAADSGPGSGGSRVELEELLALRARAGRLVVPGARTASRDGVSGPHLSRARGRGMEYAESRPYVAGDDARAIDWRVTARTGRPHTKLYQEERERPVFLVVDLAPSMFFGTRVAFKSVVAARAAALVAWSVTARGDRVGALIAAGPRHLEIRPAPGRRGAVPAVRALATLANEPPPRIGGGLAAALTRTQRVLRPGSLAVVFSDFYGLDEEALRQLARLRRHGDVLACWVHDPLELEPPPPGLYPVTDGRESAVLDLTSAEVRTAWLDHGEALRRRLEEAAGRLSFPVIELPTDLDPALALFGPPGAPRQVA